MYNELFVVNRGCGIFKLEQELAEFSCPLCNEKHFDLCNMGFVNCQWALKGQLSAASKTNIYADGQTYDANLYTFEEINYKREFQSLNIFVKKHEGSEMSGSSHSNLQVKSSSSSNSSSNESKKKYIAQAAAKYQANDVLIAAAP